MQVDWTDAEDALGRRTREFRIGREGKREITGALWQPGQTRAGSTLVCFGHGASGDRYQRPICSLARRLTEEAGLPVVALDGPVHGLRQVGDGARTAFFEEFQRDGCITEMTGEWNTTIRCIQSLPEIGAGNIAWFGLSMGSIFGIPLVASREDVVVAVLGLLGVSPGLPHGDEILSAARKINCPLLFLMQLEDELFDRAGYLTLFDALASGDKRLHANPGLHPEIPAEEIDFAFDFLTRHIDGSARHSIVNLVAD